MWIGMAPPGRTSSSHTGFANPFGPHHCATCVGSVHAAKTGPRGALKTRVRTSSGSMLPPQLLAHRLLARGVLGRQDLGRKVRRLGHLTNLDHLAVREGRSEEHTSELQSQSNLVCRLLLEKKKMNAR